MQTIRQLDADYSVICVKLQRNMNGVINQGVGH